MIFQGSAPPACPEEARLQRACRAVTAARRGTGEAYAREALVQLELIVLCTEHPAFRQRALRELKISATAGPAAHRRFAFGCLRSLSQLRIKEARPGIAVDGRR
jgi:hypothetical protein